MNEQTEALRRMNDVLVLAIKEADDALSNGNDNAAMIAVRKAATIASSSYLKCVARSNVLEALRQRVKELEERESTLNEALKLTREGAEYCFNQARDADANAAVQNAAVHELAKQLAAQAEQIRHLQMALADTEALEQGTSERCERQAEQIKVAREAIELYEQALLASWPDGAKGDAFDYWNAARNSLGETK